MDGHRYFDSVLANSTYVAGDSFSMADITLYAGYGFANFIKLEIPPELNNLDAWYERVSQRPSIKG